LNAKVPDVNTTIIIKQKRTIRAAGRSEPGTGSVAVVSIMLLFFANGWVSSRVQFFFSRWFRPNIAFVGHILWLLRKRAAQCARPARRAVVNLPPVCTKHRSPVCRLLMKRGPPFFSFIHAPYPAVKLPPDTPSRVPDVDSPSQRFENVYWKMVLEYRIPQEAACNPYVAAIEFQRRPRAAFESDFCTQ
jgi:hypothetical protein